MRISDWSSDVCSSDLILRRLAGKEALGPGAAVGHRIAAHFFADTDFLRIIGRGGGTRAHFHQRLDRPVGPVPHAQSGGALAIGLAILDADRLVLLILIDRKSTRLNSSH